MKYIRELLIDLWGSFKYSFLWLFDSEDLIDPYRKAMSPEMDYILKHHRIEFHKWITSKDDGPHTFEIDGVKHTFFKKELG